jgi:hypothetical protein
MRLKKYLISVFALTEIIMLHLYTIIHINNKYCLNKETQHINIYLILEVPMLPSTEFAVRHYLCLLTTINPSILYNSYNRIFNILRTISFFSI